jgi:excisionase family DNA binding protein
MASIYPGITGRGGLAPLAVTIATTCELTGFGLTTVWQLLKDGRLKAVRVPGIRRTLVDYPSVVQLLRSSLEAPAPRRRRGRPRKVPAGEATT